MGSLAEELPPREDEITVLVTGFGVRLSPLAAIRWPDAARFYSTLLVSPCGYLEKVIANRHFESSHLGPNIP